MYDLYIKSHGPEKAFKICRTCLEKPLVTIRANTLKTTRKELLHVL
jgi:16S rRNA C967 or C1407 C5-methylase (RsmB/RsmF family)